MNISNGVWPTMVTPFTLTNEIDYEALERVVDWYIKHQVNGLFAVCQSSEMFRLSLEERVGIAAFVKEKASGRVPVIASGHISDSHEDQLKELSLMAKTGIDALVLITNRLALEDESDEIWIANMEKLLNKLPEDIPLGLYECPYPYKRIISPEIIKWCGDTGRFFFLKDTCGDIQNIERKYAAAQGTQLKIYNANSSTLLETLQLGVAGYSGVMANFHPYLYVWLHRKWKEDPESAAHLIRLLSVTSFIEKQLYPVNAKYFLMLEGIFDNYHCRTKNHEEFTETHKLETEHLYHLSKSLSNKYPLPKPLSI